MGAWSAEPAGNDEAQEWLFNSIHHPVIEAIGKTIDSVLADSHDDTKKAEAEIAIALLLDLTSDQQGNRYVRFGIDYAARERSIWEKAIAALEGMLADRASLQNWNDPEMKSGVLIRLLAQAKSSKDRPVQPELDASSF